MTETKAVYKTKRKPKSKSTAPAPRTVGRPKNAVVRQKYTLSLQPAIADKLAEIGNGSISAGIEKLAEAAPVYSVK